MKLNVLNRHQIRQFDRVAIERFQMHSLVLMENAARGAVDEMCREQDGKSSAVVLCGPGNNGGDGLVMARHLHLRGWKTKVILLQKPEKLSQDSAANWRILTHTRVPVVVGGDVLDIADIQKELEGFDWIVDALLGTGSRPPLRQPVKQWVQVSNDQQARRIAVDIPSGLDCDTDQVDGAVFSADLTVTFVARKPVMATNTGKVYCGRTRIVDIGAPPETFDYIDGD